MTMRKENEMNSYIADVAKASAVLRLMGNKDRLLVLCVLLENGEMSVNNILKQVNLSQSMLSQHLARMRATGLVTFRRDAQALYYRIDDPNVETIIYTLKKIYNS